MNIVFTQPFLLSADFARTLPGKVVVLDIAFDAVSVDKTTHSFIEELGDRLLLWVDHHDHPSWETFQQDPRFLLVPRTKAFSCPPLLTQGLVTAYPEPDTLLAHGDFDGIMSAAKWAKGGLAPYPEADADADAIDSARGRPSATGAFLNECLKVDRSSDALRMLVFQWLLHPTLSFELLAVHEQYEAIEKETRALAEHYISLSFVAFLTVPTGTPTYDVTALLLAGQGRRPIAALLERKGTAQKLVFTAACSPKYNLREMLGLPAGGMKNRVTIPLSSPEDAGPLLFRLNEQMSSQVRGEEKW